MSLVIVLARVVWSALGPDSADPHGFLMIFGVVVGLVLLIPLAIGVLMLVSGVRRVRADRLSR